MLGQFWGRTCCIRTDGAGRGAARVSRDVKISASVRVRVHVRMCEVDCCTVRRWCIQARNMLLSQAALRLGSEWCRYAIDELHVTTWHLVALCWLH